MPLKKPKFQFSAEKKTLLYYPTIDIPSPSWLRQGVMFWDDIASIVPRSYDDMHPNERDRYSTEVHPLLEAGLYRPINPSRLSFKKAFLAEFKQELLQVLDSEEIQRRLPAAKERKYVYKVYVDKVDSHVEEELKERKLLKRHGPYFMFEQTAGLIYMALLAKHLADIDDNYVVPSTDLPQYEAFNYEVAAEEDPIACLKVEFQDVLRVPSDDVDIKRVIDFRLKRKDELLAFRSGVLDKFQETIRKCESNKDIKNETVKFRQEIERGIGNIDKMYKDEKMLNVSGTLKAIFKGGAIPTIVGVAAGTIASPIAGVALGSLVAAPAMIEVFDYFVTRRNYKRDKLRSQAYSYVYHAGKELGGGKTEEMKSKK